MTAPAPATRNELADIIGQSVDGRDPNVLRLIFHRPVTDDHRAAVVRALNATPAPAAKDELALDGLAESRDQAHERAEAAEARASSLQKEVGTLLSSAAAKGDEPDLLIEYWREAEERARVAEAERDQRVRESRALAAALAALAQRITELEAREADLDRWAVEHLPFADHPHSGSTGAKHALRLLAEFKREIDRNLQWANNVALPRIAELEAERDAWRDAAHLSACETDAIARGGSIEDRAAALLPTGEDGRHE